MIGAVPVVVLVRGGLLLVAALAVVVLGRVVPLMPDLLAPVVVAAALIRGPVTGALVGLGAGWLLDLMPPGTPMLGSLALLYAAAGAVAGLSRRPGEVSLGWVAAAAVAAIAVVGAGRTAYALLGGAQVDLALLGSQVGVSLALAAVGLGPLLRLERTLARGAR